MALLKISELNLRHRDEPHLIRQVFDPQLQVVFVTLENLQHFDEQIKLRLLEVT